MSSKKLASIALVIWFCSLALSGLVFYSETVPGFVILLIGWLSPIFLNFAWYANPLFWFAVRKLIFSKQTDKSPVISAVLATFLSFDTFRFTAMTNGLEEGSDPLYGYGWGAVLWFIAIFVLLAAVGMREQEIRKSLQFHNKLEFEYLIPLGFFLIVLTLGTSSYFFVQDRKEETKNSTELKRLSSAVFKLGTICRASDPVVKHPIRNFSGVLEVNEKDFSRYKIQELLDWGIPVVRHAGIDYSINDKYNSLLFVSATGSSSAILEKSYTGITKVHEKLIEVGSNRIVFNQTWQLEKEDGRGGGYYCPDFNSEKNKLLLLQALSLPETKVQPRKSKLDQPWKPKLQREAELKGVIIEYTKKQGNLKKTNFRHKSHHSNIELLATNCANNIELDNHSLPNRYDSLFKMKDKAYNLELRFDFAICEGNFVYLYSSGFRNGGEYYLHVEKRTLPDFSQKWARFIVISDSRIYHDNEFRLQSVKEMQNSMTLELADRKSGEIFTVQAPLPHPQ